MKVAPLNDCVMREKGLRVCLEFHCIAGPARLDLLVLID